MFCPDCRAEYRSGFSQCADCHVALLEFLPDLQENPEGPDSPGDELLLTSVLNDEYLEQGELSPESLMVETRPEEEPDYEVISELVEAAFGNPAEARLVERLRNAGQVQVSLVALSAGQIVGHILFSPVTLSTASNVKCTGLAPLAVLPDFQRNGIGSKLVRDGLEACRKRGYELAFVLGDPPYYTRFGFSPAIANRISNEYGADDAFLALELIPGALQKASGLARYSPEFAQSGV